MWQVGMWQEGRWTGGRWAMWAGGRKPGHLVEDDIAAVGWYGRHAPDEEGELGKDIAGEPGQHQVQPQLGVPEPALTSATVKAARTTQ